MTSEFFLSKENLENLYLIQKRSTREIAYSVGVSQPTIMRKLIFFNIPRRSYKENKMPIAKGGSLSHLHKQKISQARKGK